MSSTAQLQPVLDHIDADFDNSLQRLFALLRIKSISADPAHAGDCKAAADHLAKDIATLGFATEVRPTAGHPAIVAKANGALKDSARPHALFYVIMMCNRSIRSISGIVRRSSLS
jgi:acetylornithine deacetylase/succinyl-diaminopimelate desuccinylase-like protein